MYYFILTTFISLKQSTGCKTKSSLADKYKVPFSSFTSMIHEGTKLLYLSLCSKLCFQCFSSKFKSFITGSPYILALILISGQKNHVTKNLLTSDIASIGMYLRQVPSKSFDLF